ncbi:MAG: xanthine dehydrogenase family protein molybdopterin-binding subunit, partial [Nitrososphaerales archaeon]
MTSEVVLLQQKRDTIEAKQKDNEPLRTEDIRLLTGRGHFVEDLTAENQAFMSLVHSPFAHAKIKKIDLTKVRSSPAFIAALTGEDLVKEGVAPLGQGFLPPKKPWKRFHLAFGEVRYAGEPVVAILAKDRGSAEDLVDDVEIEYESLPAVTSIEEAKQGKTLVYPSWGSNLSQSIKQRKGDADSAISSAAHVINVREGIMRQEGASMEPHAVVASYDKERDAYEVLATVQSVHFLRESLSHGLKIPKVRIHVKVMDMGGGFGAKGAHEYPWTLLACLFAKKTGLTVKFVASRTEEFLESAAGRDAYCDLTLACDKDGRILALKARIECDIGVPGDSAFGSMAIVGTIPLLYKIPDLDLEARSYVTNKKPVGPIRGAGRPEGNYFTERAVEIMAKEIGLDPIEFRHRNAASPESDSIDHQGLLDTLAKSADYQGMLRWRDEMNSRYVEENEKKSKDNNGGGSTSPTKLAGIGLSLRGGEARFSPRAIFGNISLRGIIAIVRLIPRFRSFSSESGRVTLNKRGEVRVYTGSSPHGQGHETVFAQLASEELGVRFEKVEVVWGDTTLIPRGVGTFGSRSVVAGGSAVVDSSRRLKLDLIKKASKILRTSPDLIDIRDGAIVEAKRQENVLLGLGEILDRLGLSEISADSKFTPKSTAQSSGAHLCALTLDIETGAVKIERYVVAEDCGRIINKAIVEGQLHGAVAHGVGGSLLEKLVYDADGNLLTTNFMDYSIPTSTDSPNIELFYKVTPSQDTLHHARGMGESGTIASYAAILNALNDA